MKIDVNLLSSDEINRIVYDQLALLSRDIIGTVGEKKYMEEEVLYQRLRRFKRHLNWVENLQLVCYNNRFTRTVSL